MSLRFKHIEKNETYRVLQNQFPLYLTDEFQVWYYAVLDPDTVLVVSSNSCQVQSFDETFNSKYSVAFDELSACGAAEFHHIYTNLRARIAQADHKYQALSSRYSLRVASGFLADPEERITAKAS